MAKVCMHSYYICIYVFDITNSSIESHKTKRTLSIQLEIFYSKYPICGTMSSNISIDVKMFTGLDFRHKILLTRLIRPPKCSHKIFLQLKYMSNSGLSLE